MKLNKEKLEKIITFLIATALIIAITIYIFKTEISVIEQYNITTLLNKLGGR